LKGRLAGVDRPLIESIRSHLSRMLNTRQGHALVAPDYGMPDLTGFAHAPAAVEELRRAITMSIRKFEPRLASVQVSPGEENEFRVIFHITATLSAGAAKSIIHFETAVEGSGRILVRG
jgi:type VI secretion system protein